MISRKLKIDQFCNGNTWTFWNTATGACRSYQQDSCQQRHKAAMIICRF